MDEVIIFLLFPLLLFWIAMVAYMIYKDHGIIEYIDGVPYKNMISINPSPDGDQLNLRKRWRERFKKW